jgi:hypothetical protein
MDENRDLIQNSFDLAIRGSDIRTRALNASKEFKLQSKLVASPVYISTRSLPKPPKVYASENKKTTEDLT